jgi:RNAse (barnase) inhibitor barstar
MQYELDCSNIKNKLQFLVEIGRLLNFPPYYSYNLDSLEEILGDYSQVTITFNNCENLKTELPDWTTIEDIFNKSNVGLILA